MKITIATVGKPRLAYAREGLELYFKRISAMQKIEWRHVKSGSSEDECSRLLEATEGCYRIAMDEKGKALRSMDWAAKFSDFEMRSVDRAAFIVGGADGLTDGFRRTADAVWSLGCMTMQHELALVVLSEQIYRALTIKAGTPYHREG